MKAQINNTTTFLKLAVTVHINQSLSDSIWMPNPTRFFQVLAMVSHSSDTICKNSLIHYKMMI